MSPFEFFFTLYGLVLGLSVVEVVSGFARLAHDARGVRIGLLTPVLALLLLTDLCGFWLGAYQAYSDRPLGYGVIVLALGASALYYVAASVVLPRDFGREPDLDEVYLRHRRLVMVCVAAAGLTMFELIPSLSAEGRAARLDFWTDLSLSWQPMIFFACIPPILLIRRKAVNLALLLVMLGVNVTSFLRLPPLS